MPCRAFGEGRDGLVGQEVRLVDDQVVERGQRVAAGEQEGVVHADEVGRAGRGAGQAPVAARARPDSAGPGRWRPRRATRGRGRRGPAGPWRAVGQRRDVDLAPAGAADQASARQGAAASGRPLAGIVDRLVEPAPAEVVLATHEQRPAKPGGQGRSATSGSSGPRTDAAGPWSWCSRSLARPLPREEGGREQIGEALAHAGAGLEQSYAAVAQHGRSLVGQLDLARPMAKAGEARGEPG